MSDRVDMAAPQPFMTHLMELRARLILCLLAVGACMVLALVFRQALFGFLRRPLDHHNRQLLEAHREQVRPLEARLDALNERLTQLPATADTLRVALEAKRAQLRDEIAERGAPRIITLRPTGPLSSFLLVMKIGLWGGVVLALPLIVAQLWGFVRPGLHAHERRAIAPIFTVGLVLFVLGATVAYIYVLPTGLQWLYSWDAELGLESTNRIADYVGFVLRLLVAFGVAFELPLVVFALTSLGVVEPQMLWRKKRYALLVALAVGALLTPPDIFSQVVLGACLLGLYFLALALSSLASRRHRQARDAAPDASSDDAAATPSSAAAAPDAGESDKTA